METARILFDRLSGVRFVRFAFVGGLATVVQYAVLAVLVEAARAPALAAAIVAYGCGATTSYLLNRRLTFAGTTTGFAGGFAKFMAVTVVGLALNTAIFASLQAVGAHYLAAQAVATVLVLGWNYFGARTFVFR